MQYFFSWVNDLKNELNAKRELIQVIYHKTAKKWKCCMGMAGLFVACLFLIFRIIALK